MKHVTPFLIAGAMLCACQQTPRNTVQMEAPVFHDGKACCVRTSEGGDEVSPYKMVTIDMPEARKWDAFDRADAVIKYNKMPVKDKEILFDTIARVYSNLPEKHSLSSETINLGIWKEVTSKGVDLSFGKDPADWHPYLMYIHPIVIAEMTNFFILAKDGSITNEELNQWQKAGCNVINAKPDSISMAALLARRKELEKAGIIITETENGYRAHTVKVDWDKYRAEHHQ